MNNFQIGVRQSGYTVVELLIAGTLGLVLLAGVGQLFVGSSQTFRMQRQLADVQDAGRFAIGFLRDEIERAGWRDDTNTPMDMAFLLAPSVNTPADMCPGNVCTLDGGADVSDAFTVRYEADADCVGNAVASGIVENRFLVGGADNRQLLCFGNGGAVAQPLIDDVDAMQVLYGFDSDGDGVANSYFNFSTVPADQIGNVVSVRVALLIAGEENRSIPKTPRTYQVGDRLYQFDDQTPRRVFSITAMVRNPPLI